MLRLQLQLFAEGGGEGAGGEGQNAAASGLDFESEFKRQFGSGIAAPKSEAEAAPEPEGKAQVEKDREAADTPEKDPEKDPDKDFEGLIKGEYKDAFNRRVQGIINERFKNNNAKLAAAEQKAADVMDAFRPYLEKLGLDGSDLEAVRNAAMEDRSNFRSYAVQNNMTVEEAAQKLQEQWNAAKQQQQAELQQQAQADAQMQAEEQQRQWKILDGWKAEEATLKKTHPEFSLAHEVATNAEFRKALDAGMSVQFAYRATHYDDDLANVAGAVERQTKINTAQSIAAGMRRPPEGGMNANTATQSRTSYKNLSDQDFLKIFNKTL